MDNVPMGARASHAKRPYRRERQFVANHDFQHRSTSMFCIATQDFTVTKTRARLVYSAPIKVQRGAHSHRTDTPGREIFVTGWGTKSEIVDAFVLDLVQPLAARRQLIGFGWKARRDKPGRQSTLQHVDQIKLGNGDCKLSPSP